MAAARRALALLPVLLLGGCAAVGDAGDACVSAAWQTSERDACAAHVADTDAWTAGARWTWTLACEGQPTRTGSYALGPARLQVQTPYRRVGETWQHCAPRIGVPCGAGTAAVRAPLAELRGDPVRDGEYRRRCGAPGSGRTFLYLDGPDGRLLRCTADEVGTGCEDARSDARAAPVPGCTLAVTRDAAAR